MTDVSNLVTKLDGDKSLITQVLKAKAGGFDLPATSALELQDLLNAVSLFGTEVYPVYLPQGASYPSCVYQLIGVDTFEVDGYRITQTDAYTLKIRVQTDNSESGYSQFETKFRAVIAELRTSNYSIEPVDLRVSYDDVLKVIVGELDIEMTYIVQPGGGTPGNDSTELPAAFIYPIGRSAEDSEYDNLVRQVVTDMYAVVLITVDGNMPALISEVQGSFLGYGQSAEYFDMEYVSGQNLGGVSNMEVWREIYKDSHAITET